MRSNRRREMEAVLKTSFYAKSIANLKSHSLIWVTVYAWSAKNWQRLLTWWTRKFYLRSDGLAAYYYTCMKKQMRNIGKWNHIEHYLISRYSKFSQERFTMPNEKSSPGARTLLSNLLFMMKRFSMVQTGMIGNVLLALGLPIIPLINKNLRYKNKAKVLIYLIC